MIVAPADPRAPGPSALLRASHALMEEMFPPEDNHYLDIDALTAPHIRFFAATEGEQTLGTGAIAIMEGYGEVKSMFTAPAARGRGVADAILSALEAAARAEGLPLLRLETGTGLDAAHRLYTRHGFAPRGPFGDYAANKTSLFFEKALAP